jgi:hypothetical protein
MDITRYIQTNMYKYMHSLPDNLWSISAQVFDMRKIRGKKNSDVPNHFDLRH